MFFNKSVQGLAFPLAIQGSCKECPFKNLWETDIVQDHRLGGEGSYFSCFAVVCGKKNCSTGWQTTGEGEMGMGKIVSFLVNNHSFRWLLESHMDLVSSLPDSCWKWCHALAWLVFLPIFSSHHTKRMAKNSQGSEVLNSSGPFWLRIKGSGRGRNPSSPGPKLNQAPQCFKWAFPAAAMWPCKPDSFFKILFSLATCELQLQDPSINWPFNVQIL